MRPLRLIVVDADTPLGTNLCSYLEDHELELVRGARNQQRLVGLPVRASGVDLTVPVGDATDGAVVLTTVEDAVGPLTAVVIPVGSSDGSIGARVRMVSEAMALAEGLCVAAESRTLPVYLVGAQARAVSAFVEDSLERSPALVVVATPECLVSTLREPSTGPRRARWTARARRIARRVLPDPSA